MARHRVGTLPPDRLGRGERLSWLRLISGLVAFAGFFAFVRVVVVVVVVGFVRVVGIVQTIIEVEAGLGSGEVSGGPGTADVLTRWVAESFQDRGAVRDRRFEVQSIGEVEGVVEVEDAVDDRQVRW